MQNYKLDNDYKKVALYSSKFQKTNSKYP